MISKSALTLLVLCSGLVHAEAAKIEKCFVVESIGWNGHDFQKQQKYPLELTVESPDRTLVKTKLVKGIALDLYAGGGSTGHVPSLVLDIKVTDKKTGATSNSTNFFIKGSDELPNNRGNFIYNRANGDTVSIDCFPAL